MADNRFDNCANFQIRSRCGNDGSLRCLDVDRVGDGFHYQHQPASFWKRHIKFPAYAIGQKISCAHDYMGFTLKEAA
jgi:hypothetical protein